MPFRFRPTWIAAFGALTLFGCKGDEPPRERLAPPAPAKPATCEGGGATIADPESAPIFPRTTGGFCLDPNGEVKTFGDGGSLPLDGICDLFDGECEIYKGFGVKRVVELRYVDGAGSPATIDIHLSKFASSEGAYAMLTQRIVGDGDPVDEATPRPIEGGGVGALGLGNAYVWRGPFLAELTYNDESAAEAAMKTAGDRLLPPLVKAIGEKLPGSTDLPAAAAALPKANQVPLGARLESGDVLDAAGVGPGAFGYYREGEKRYRFVVLVRQDADQAKDVLATFGKLPGATREKVIGEGAVRAMRPAGEGSATEWFFARKGSQVIGIGDEPRVLRKGMPVDELARVTLSREEKITRLKDAL